MLNVSLMLSLVLTGKTMKDMDVTFMMKIHDFVSLRVTTGLWVTQQTKYAVDVMVVA